MVVSLNQVYDFCLRREPEMLPQEVDFWAYLDAYEFACELLDGLQAYVSQKLYEMLVCNLTLHYIIVTQYELEDGSPNPLYVKYNIAEASKGIVSSASDESSSASLHITDAMNSLSYLGMDWVTTPYGKTAYAILSSLNVTPVLL